MAQEKLTPTRFIGIDLHKHYLVACGVDAQGQEVLHPCRVPLSEWEDWRQKRVTSQDAVVLEMTTNALQIHDELLPHVHSVTVVHPPHVKLIVRNRVMTDKIASRILAKLHAKDLLVGIWIPPQPVRELRALLAQRSKMVRLATQAKNRLHAVLHRHHWVPPEGNLFALAMEDWWLALPVSSKERMRIQCDLETLTFAQRQCSNLEAALTTEAANDERVPLLVQLTGISIINALTLLAGIGDIARFPTARHLVGYVGLGAAVHDSGQRRREGSITKEGRRDMRATLIEAAQSAVNYDPRWRAELRRLEPRLGRNKAIVAIARKLLVTVWHVLTKGAADRYADPERVARKLLRHAYNLGQANREPGEGTGEYVRRQLDNLGIGQELACVRWGQRKIVPLPPSRLAGSPGR